MVISCNMLPTLNKLPGWMMASFSAIILIALMYYADSEGHSRYLMRINQIENATRHHDTPICIGYLKIISVQSDRVIAVDGHNYQYRLVTGKSVTLLKNEKYSVSGKVAQDGSIYLENVQHHPNRCLKYLISSLSLIIISYLIIRNIRISKEGLIYKTVTGPS